MVKTRLLAIFILLMGALIGYFIVAPHVNPGSIFDRLPFRLGLDLKGGAHLTYKADTASLGSGEIGEAMAGLRDVIERRVNMYGVTESVVQVEQSGSAFNPLEREQRLIVELPGVVNLDAAIKMIGATPYLEFKTERMETDRDIILEAQKKN